MEWREEGIILGLRRHGETSVIAEILTSARGRWLGLVRGGRSRVMRPVLQPGNLVLANWRARLEDHLGTFVVEPVSLRAGAIMADALQLAGLATLTALAHFLPEREPHPRICEAMQLVIDRLDDPDIWPALLVRWELGLLDELGFGLDLGRCVVTGSNEDLVYVSPKTGRAVSRGAGQAYRNRLLTLPDFLKGSQASTPEVADVIAGFELTGHFLTRHVFEPRGASAPESRSWIMARLAQSPH
jgi:DNA repair protein RecO (recombination protein O)